MIERYTRDEMKKIWELENKFQTYLDVEIAVCRAYNSLGFIHDFDLKQIIDNAISDLMEHNSYHAYVPADLNDNSIKIVFEDINALIPARNIATITVTHI